jgi:hypothetical protein
MNREEVFEIWGPAGSAWADWVKPVLFAQMPGVWSGEDVVPSETVADLGDFARMEGALMVVDLEGEESVRMGLGLARSGYRPVPLFNGAMEESAGMLASIKVRPMMRALSKGAGELRELHLPLDAPPTFLLDARRRMGEVAPGAGVFDNRWISFPTDFPSGRVLMERGILRAVVVMRESAFPAADLVHTLLRWQEAGMEILVMQLGVDESPRRIEVKEPSHFRWAMYQFLEMFGFRRRVLGGFGGLLSESGGGG